MRRVAVCVAVCAGLVVTSSASARVLRVGTFHGINGPFATIQAAVNAARPGDWILIGPGDYKTTTSRHPAGHSEFPAGVLVTKPRIYIRGMNRNTVIVDGTKPGSAPCSRKKSAQNFGPSSKNGKLGLNGIEVWKANNVWVQNLTACNFLGGAGSAGNEIWWNGGGAGKIGGKGMIGSYLNATSTYFGGEKTAAQYGIFSSNWNGGRWDQTYASNFNDSGYYIGACLQVCNQTVNHAWAEFNALGYSGSNSGGRLLVENSQFDNNKDGFDTNSQNGDNPPPQNGACPAGVKPPVAGAPTCWVFTRNYVHDNNNPNVPGAGSADEGPVGTGVSVSGGRNDTLMNNRFVNNGAWGVVFIAFPDSGPPCTGGTKDSPLIGKGSCLYDDWGNHLINNRFTHNGGFGNPTNGDFEELRLESHPNNCYSGNTDSSGSLNAESAALEAANPTCSSASAPPNLNTPFLNEVVCDTQASLPPFGCVPTDHYPRRTKVVMHKLPKHLKTMANPCKGVPANPWCRAKHGQGQQGAQGQGY
jgi:hypothetical protein